MIIKDIFGSEVAVKVFYTYLAVSLGHTGIQTVNDFKPDVLETKIAHVEKKIDRLEGLMIDMLKSKAGQ